jgi:hypothetical protein
MRGKIVFGAALAIVVALAAPRSARGCGAGGGSSGYAGLATAALLLGTTDVVFTLWDGGSALASHHPSVGYGVLETLVAGPQLALGIAGLSAPRNGASGFFAVYTLWMALLTSHGIWTIATASPATTATVEPLEPKAVLQQSEPQPRLQVGVGPTYVPLGQLSQPGFGVVGRF